MFFKAGSDDTDRAVEVWDGVRLDGAQIAATIEATRSGLQIVGRPGYRIDISGDSQGGCGALVFVRRADTEGK